MLGHFYPLKRLAVESLLDFVLEKKSGVSNQAVIHMYNLVRTPVSLLNKLLIHISIFHNVLSGIT